MRWASLTVVLLAGPLVAADFDIKFRKAARIYWGDISYVQWHHLKAQAKAESSLNPKAQSHAGAQGLLQILPSTWGDITRDQPSLRGGSPFEPRYAIQGGAYYLRQQFNRFKDVSETVERYRMALGSYNAGFGNIRKARRHAEGADKWYQVVAALPSVTSVAHARETGNYIIRVEQFAQELNQSRRGEIVLAMTQIMEEEEMASPEVQAVELAAQVAEVAGKSEVSWWIMLVNVALSYKFMIISSLIGIAILRRAYLTFDKLTKFSTSDELYQGNLAVAAFVCTVLLMVGGIIIMAIFAGIGG